jgi:hypothetical protein
MDVVTTYGALAAIVYNGYQSIAPERVELTATSLTVRRLFFSTRVLARKDIDLCNLSYLRWGRMCLGIKHRNPMAGVVVLGNLNCDDIFWRWFSGIPGKRELR